MVTTTSGTLRQQKQQHLRFARGASALYDVSGDGDGRGVFQVPHRPLRELHEDRAIGGWESAVQPAHGREL